MATNIKMVSKNEDNLMINTQIMKITGLYYLLDSRSPKIFGHNVFKCIFFFQISILLLLMVIFSANIYYFLGNIDAVIQYTISLTSDVIMFVKLYTTVVNSDTIWNCIQKTCIEELSYKYHNRSILKNCQFKSKSYSIQILFIWINLLLSWGLAPLFVTNYYLELEVENKIYRYRFNIMNLVFPVTDQFYNNNFMIYYYIEFFCVIIWFHSTIIFDVLLLSTNIMFKYQLKTIANSFSTFNITHYIKNNLTKNDKHNKESELMSDFKSIIYDQQRVIENMRNIYRILKPVILIHLAFESIGIVLQSCMIIMNYFSGMSLTSAINMRLYVAVFSFAFHIYVICYLFDDVYQQKDSINFALYSSDWTQSNAQYKILLLQAMQMNDAENLRLQVTTNKIVNFKLFTDIMRTTYSILSVLGKICANRA